MSTTRSASTDTIAFLYGAVFFAYILLWPLSRNLGTVGYAVLLLSALAAVTRQRVLIDNIALLLVMLLAAIYAFLSLWDVFPTAWTLLHDNSVIVQQALGYLTLPVFVAANLRLIGAAAAVPRNTLIRLGFAYALFCFAVTPFLLTLDQSGDLSGGADGRLQFALLNTFFSSEVILIALLGYVVLRVNGTGSLVAGAVFLAMSTNVQPVLAILLALAYRTGILRERATLGIVVGLLGACLLSTLFVERLIELDINTGIRAAFWRGSLEALVETRGIGVGFGTEAIRSGYYFRFADWIISQEAGDYLLIGMHNSFFNIGFRLGLLGLLLLVISVNAVRPRVAHSPFHNWLYVLIVLDLCVNVTIESASFDLGFTFLLALVIHLNKVVSSMLRAAPVEQDAPVGSGVLAR